jgi:hypothetical protein
MGIYEEWFLNIKTQDLELRPTYTTIYDCFISMQKNKISTLLTSLLVIKPVFIKEEE